MKKILAVMVMSILLVGAVGCGAQLSDLELLDQTFTNMQDMESYKSEAAITIAMMGMTMDPIEYEIQYEQPDKTYMKMDADLSGTGERTSIEFLIQGEEIKLRSEMLDEMDAGLREMMETSITEEMENPQQYEDMFLELGDMTDFEVIDNPHGLEAKDYKTFKMTMDRDQLKQQIADEMNPGEDFLPPEAEEFDPEELEAFETMVEDMLNNLEVEMEAILVVNTETSYFHSLEMDMSMSFPFPDFSGTGQQEKINMNYGIEIEYLEINTDLEFPDFE